MVVVGEIPTLGPARKIAVGQQFAALRCRTCGYGRSRSWCREPRSTKAQFGRPPEPPEEHRPAETRARDRGAEILPLADRARGQRQRCGNSPNRAAISRTGSPSAAARPSGERRPEKQPIGPAGLDRAPFARNKAGVPALERQKADSRHRGREQNWSENGRRAGAPERRAGRCRARCRTAWQRRRGRAAPGLASNSPRGRPGRAEARLQPLAP